MYHSIGLLLVAAVTVNAYGYMDSAGYDNPLLDYAELMKKLGDRDSYSDLFDLDNRAENYFMPYNQFPGSDDYGTVARPRDIEVEENPELTGSKSISGGTGRTMQNQISKSDKVLPSYCNPPNPCPKGIKSTEKHKCLSRDEFKNTAAENEAYNARQKCPCDEEHMRYCSKGKSTVSSKTENEAASQLLLKELDDSGLLPNPFAAGEKRKTLVAKKSPGMYRKK